MKKLLVLLLLAPLPLFAGTFPISWTHPTQYVDGSALAVSDITSTRLEIGNCTGTFVAAKSLTVPKVGTADAPKAVTSPDMAPGTYCVRGYTTAKGLESDASPLSPPKTITQSPPKPPVFASVDLNVYQIQFPKNSIAMSKVGTVPLGTVCDGARGIWVPGLTCYPVAREKVKWSGSVQPSTVCTQCRA